MTENENRSLKSEVLITKVQFNCVLIFLVRRVIVLNDNTSYEKFSELNLKTKMTLF